MEDSSFDIPTFNEMEISPVVDANFSLHSIRLDLRTRFMNPNTSFLNFLKWLSILPIKEV